MDDADDGAGYSCFGGVGVTAAYPTGLWVPGNDAPLVPPHEGVGYYLPVGWAFVVLGLFLDISSYASAGVNRRQASYSN